jgi:hypothetical protein
MAKKRVKSAFCRCRAEIALALSLALVTLGLAPSLHAQGSSTIATAVQGKRTNSPALSPGKRLMLKDGSFQLVREYQVEGDRVRYYSLDRSQWEEIPATLVDWDQTKKVAAEEATKRTGLVSRVEKAEAERNPEPLDIDASVEVAPGVFLPPGQGLFAFDGTAVFKLSQARVRSNLSKKNAIEQVLVPVPIVPTRHNISIERPHAENRVTTGQPEFYLRTTDEREPDLELIRARTRGDNREIEHLDQLFGQQRFTKKTLPLQRWEMAPGLYRFTLSTPLDPGEYALAQIVPDEAMSIYVWDFGVDATSRSKK